MTYSEKLKDPRWQKKRLEIMQRDDFTCRTCCAGLGDGITLNVDHKVYHRGLDPWEYHDEDLQTLCENCHREFTTRRQRIANQIGRMDERGLALLERFLAVAPKVMCVDGVVFFPTWNEKPTWTPRDAWLTVDKLADEHFLAETEEWLDYWVPA